MLTFDIAPEVRALGVRGAFAIVEGLDNASASSALERYLAELKARLATTLTPQSVADDPVLRGFRELHERVGRSSRRFPASAESLANLFLRKGIVPRINPVVDIYNAVSLETRLSLGAHDIARVAGNITLRLTRGDERFVPLGASGPEPVGPGEYAYVDDDNRILCRLEHRQCEQTKVTPQSTACFYILQGNGATPRAAIEHALDRLVSLTTTLCGGRCTESWIVD